MSERADAQAPMSEPRALHTRRLLGPRTLIYFYRRRLRAHATQELLAGVGIAAGVALVLAAGIAQGSITSSTRQVLRAVIGPANLQLRARGPQGFSEAKLHEVEALPGVKQAAPLLERSMRIEGAAGRRASVYVAGTDVSLGVLNGLGRTLPLSAYQPHTIALSAASARALGVSAAALRAHASVTLAVGGVARSVRVSAILGEEAVGASLAQARLAVMPLASMQQLLGEAGRVSRILVQAAPGKARPVRAGLARIAAGKLNVAGAEEDITQLKEALRPAGQASALFAIIGALLGFLLAFNAILLTVPERRQAIADLRLSGTRRSAIAQLVIFQALCLGLAASAVGIAVGELLSRSVFQQSTGYLAAAFALSGATVTPPGAIVLAALGGVAVTCLASSVPLLDLRRSRPADLVYQAHGVPGNTLAPRTRRLLAGASVVMLVLASALYASVPAAALVASVALALATVLALPAVFAGVLAAAHALSERRGTLSTLAVALGGVRATTVRSLALAATGAVALFGSIALGGARSDLLAGIHSFAHAYAADAPVWVSEPGDNGQATGRLQTPGLGARIARLQGVGSVSELHGSFLTLGQRRVWVIARAPGGAGHVLAAQTLGGPGAAARAEARLAGSGWVAVSDQIAGERHTRVGGTLTLQTPTGGHSYRIAALTTNLAWSPGVIFMSAGDYQRAWGEGTPSALAIQPRAGSSAQRIRSEVAAAAGAGSDVEVASASERQASIDRLTSEGLSQLAIISTLLVIMAITALAAALASSISQRRRALAGLRLSGAPPARLRRILLVEGSLMLGAGCVTGALAGFYGQFVIDSYLRHVTGFPVASAGASVRPLEVLVLVLVAALVAVALPAWSASRVSPALALAEE
jgi:putative ABC transport system permease protein